MWNREQEGSNASTTGQNFPAQIGIQLIEPSLSTVQFCIYGVVSGVVRTLKHAIKYNGGGEIGVRTQEYWYIEIPTDDVL